MIPIQQSVTSFDGQLDVSGYLAAKSKATATRKAQVREAARLFVDVMEGRQDPFLLRQAFRPTQDYAVAKLAESYPRLLESSIGGMSVTDFGALTLDVLDRLMYGYWNATPVLSRPMMREHTLSDFRTVSRYLIDGGVTPTEIVEPGAQPKEKVLTNNAPIQYAAQKYEAFTRVVWEAIVNDDLGIFMDLPKRLVIGCNRAMELFLTGLYVDANGPNATLYTSTFKNQIITANGAASNNPALDAQGLQDAFKVIARQVDADGYPIVLTGRAYLWYGPAYTGTVKNLMNQLNVQVSVNGGTVNTQGFPTQFVNVNNWMVQNLTPIENPFIRLVCTTATTQDTMWGITFDPAGYERPAMEFGTLRGFQTPQIYQKAPNTMRPGGGLAPELGDFSTMSQEMKVLCVWGGKQIDGRTSFSSTGRGV